MVITLKWNQRFLKQSKLTRITLVVSQTKSIVVTLCLDSLTPVAIFKQLLKVKILLVTSSNKFHLTNNTVSLDKITMKYLWPLLLKCKFLLNQEGSSLNLKALWKDFLIFQQTKRLKVRRNLMVIKQLKTSLQLLQQKYHGFPRQIESLTTLK